MEIAAFAGLLGLGYFASQKKQPLKEGYESAPLNPPVNAAASQYDVQFNPSKIQGNLTHLPMTPPVISQPSQHALSSQALLQMRPDRWETANVSDGGIVSALSGVEFRRGEFTHGNMVPFFRGQLKQNTIDTANTHVLDSHVGSGSLMFSKREQTPFFEPTKEPMGNPFGLESTTDFMASRIVESSNRANETPVESIRVGPGLNAGYTHLPSGGFQQTAGEEYVLQRMPKTDDLRTANNPKLTYDAPVITGAHFNAASANSDTVGEVRKYNPDTFYINENGERNFVTVGADTKPAMIPVQVLKNTTRAETTRAYGGIAGQSEGGATYSVASTRAPLVKQLGDWGFRNADLTSEFNPDTDAEENDYGRSGVVLLPNERSITGERVHVTNLRPDKREGTVQMQDNARQTRAQELIDNNWIGGATYAVKKLTVYDPNNVAKTTIRETTEDGDYRGITAPAAYKLTVYDPNDTAKTTIRETTEDGDYRGITAVAAHKLTVYDPNDVARTTIRETTEDSDYRGITAVAAHKLTVYDPNDTAKTTMRETTEDNNYLGISAPANMAQKLTVYDPDDIAKITLRNTLKNWDIYRNMGRQDTPQNATVRIQDGVRMTQKAGISAKSSYTGIAETAGAKAETNRQAARAMRHYAQKENIAKGRELAGSSVKIFNGEDWINQTYRRLTQDSINDRELVVDRVTAQPTSAEAIGLHRPRAVLRMDIDSQRMDPSSVASLETNPYVIPLHKVAA
jgi:hypothetical protein